MPNDGMASQPTRIGGTEPRLEAAKVRLREVLKSGRTTVDYLYDFGDSWEHRLSITDVRAGDPNLSYQPVDEVGLSLIRWRSDEDGW